jgi:hypothetical protein
MYIYTICIYVQYSIPRLDCIIAACSVDDSSEIHLFGDGSYEAHQIVRSVGTRAGDCVEMAMIH